MARQTFDYPDAHISVHISNPGNTYVTIEDTRPGGTQNETISMRLKLFRKINNDINKAHWKDD